jgi:hypothetical protein
VLHDFDFGGPHRVEQYEQLSKRVHHVGFIFRAEVLMQDAPDYRRFRLLPWPASSPFPLEAKEKRNKVLLPHTCAYQ